MRNWPTEAGTGADEGSLQTPGTYEPGMGSPAAQVPALGPLMDAFRRGTKRSRLRTLVVVCPQGHTLLEVFPTPEGPHALWRQRDRWGRDEATGAIVEFKPARETWVAEAVPDDVDNDHDLALLLGSACRCTESSRLRLSWIRRQLDAGARRVVAES